MSEGGHVAAAPDALPTGPHIPASPQETTKLGIWLWLASDCALFASLIATYLSLHGQTNGGPTSQQLFNLKYTLGSTFALLLSSVTMGFGLEAMQRNDIAGLRRWLVVTALLGLVFVGMEINEFHGYTVHGLWYQRSDFASAFYTLVGFHGLHVTFGVAWILSLLIFTFRKPGGITAADHWRFEMLSLYWYFVDVVWVVIFTVIYLIGKVG